MEMDCTWSHKLRLPRISQNTTCSAEMLSSSRNVLFFVLHFGKLQWFWCLHWVLHSIVVHITICTYVYIYIFIYTVWQINCFFHNSSLCFSKNMYLVLNRHECNFQLRILHFLKIVLHPFMLFMSAFHKRTCPNWTYTSSKGGLTTIESRPFPGIIYILP